MIKLFKQINLTVNKLYCPFASRELSTNLKLQSHKTPTSDAVPIEAKEIRIDVPWGHLAGKWYGSQSIRPILMFHGWQDNIGTFDTLIPKLPKHLSYLAIDFPGHGFSSQLPHGMTYTSNQCLQSIFYVQNHFKWDKLSFCSHSLGGNISFMYAALYPDKCDLVICLDALLLPSKKSVTKRIHMLQTYGRDPLKLVALHLKGEPPTYSYDECINRWVKQSTFDHKSASYLMKRGVIESKIKPNQFYYSRDIRLKLMDFNFGLMAEDLYRGLAKNITAPHLYVRGKVNALLKDEKVAYATEILKDGNPKFEWFEIDAPHHCHLTHPELMSERISDFITKYRPTSDS